MSRTTKRTLVRVLWVLAAALLGCVGLFLLSAAIHPADHLFASLVLRFIALVATVVIISILREREKAVCILVLRPKPLA